jgi:Zn-dependent protease with chaperone function
MQLSVSTKNKLKGLACLGVLAALTFGMASYFGFAYGMMLHIASVVIDEAPIMMMQPYFFYGYGIKVIDKTEITEVEGFNLNEIVEELAIELGISPFGIRRIGIIMDDSLQAFTTGSSLLSLIGLDSHGIAISRGLLRSAKEYARSNDLGDAGGVNIIKAVIAHELGHIAHHDTTIGVITHMTKQYFNFFAKIMLSEAFFIAKIPGYVTTAIALFAQFLVKTYERTQEIAADEVAFDLGYGKSMCHAFEIFKESKTLQIKAAAPAAADGVQYKVIDVQKDYNNLICDFARLFFTHPTDDERIAHLKALEEEKDNPELQGRQRGLLAIFGY